MGLAAPQVGESVALSVIGIKPTPNRPNLERFDQVIINPEYKGIGEKVGMWEGCQSGGSAQIFAQAMCYEEVNATWHDEHAELHRQKLNGFVAHVFQHEADHLDGVLFFERVQDPRTYMDVVEYRKRIGA